MALAVSPQQAQYVLEKLVEQRKISHNDVVRALALMRREIDSLEERLNALRQLSAARTATRRDAVTTRSRAGRPRRNGKVSARQLASRKLQGQYLGLLTRIPKKDRARFQKMATEQGREAAIKAMRAAKTS